MCEMLPAPACLLPSEGCSCDCRSQSCCFTAPKQMRKAVGMGLKVHQQLIFIYIYHLLSDSAVRCRAGSSLVGIQQFSYFTKTISTLQDQSSEGFLVSLCHKKLTDHGNKPSCLLTEGDFFLVLFLLRTGTGGSYITAAYVNQHPKLALGSSRRLIHSLETRK